MHERWGSRIYGKYGFVDAFNPKIDWIDTDVIGINAGIILLSAENMRTANVWRWFMRNREIPRTLDRIGLVRYKKASTMPSRNWIPEALKFSSQKTTDSPWLRNSATMFS